MKKVIFDTDIGIDDAMALLFLHYSPAVDLLAIVTGFGNASVDSTTRNTLYIFVVQTIFPGSVYPSYNYAGIFAAGALSGQIQ